MFFSKKNKKTEIKCFRCQSKVDKKFSYCPDCGAPLRSSEDEAKDFGMLGKHDMDENEFKQRAPMNNNLGMLDRMVNSLMANIIKQMNEAEKKGEGMPLGLPRGIKIEIGLPGQKRKTKRVPQSQAKGREITQEQIDRMSTLPRAQAKTNVKRLSDKVIYELSAPGITSPEDVFFSKLETGYEIKAIADKKVYINSLPVELPLRGFAIKEDKLLVEFKLDLEEEFQN